MSLRPTTLIGILLSLVTGLSLGILLHLHASKAEPNEAGNTVAEALREVARNYVEDVSEEELARYAIEGMMRGLDDHSDYLDTRAFESLQEATTGRFGGIGIELGLVDGYFTVIAPMDDTPAARAGLKPGDRIIRVDGEPVKGMNMNTLIDRLRGEPGSSVALSVKQKKDPVREVDLERALIRVASVRSRLLEPGYGYIRISQFQTTTGRDVAEHLEKLSEADGAPLLGLVLDLRNNPGGTLQSSVEVADHFLNQGTIVSTSGRLASAASRYAATKGDMLSDAPIVVLINEGSASASEIVAASLKDHTRATIMGSTSYGKGSVQSLLPLAHAQALKLTTAYYYSPDGNTIHGVGVEPDVPFSGDEESWLDEAVTLLKNKTKNRLHARAKIEPLSPAE